jgi:hypothetical protein
MAVMTPRIGLIRAAGLAVVQLISGGLMLQGHASAAEAEPFRTRNLNPLIAIYAAPSWDVTHRPGGHSLDVSVDLASHDWFEAAGDHSAELDAETWRAALLYRRQFAGDWAASVEIPWVRVSGGVLDSVIDRWHRMFGLPHGSRGERPVGATLLRFADEGGVLQDLQRPQSSLGDVRVAFSRRLPVSEGYTLNIAIKLPTGSRALTGGSGAADLAVTAARVRQGRFRGSPAAYFWGAGVVATGTPKVATFKSRSLVPVAMLGGGWRFRPKLGIKGQLDLHGRYYDSPLAIGRHGIQLTLGGWWDIGVRARFEFGVNEDLTVHTSPDVVLHTAMRWSF